MKNIFKKVLLIISLLFLINPLCSLAMPIDIAEDYVKNGDDLINALTTDALFNEFKEKSNNNTIKEAISFYNQAIQAAPNYIYPYLKKGCVLYIRDKYEEALVSLNKAIKISPDCMNQDVNILGHSFSVYWLIAQSYFGLKQYDNVVKQFELIGKSNPKNLDNYINELTGMAGQLSIMKQYTYALKICDLALLKQTNNADIYYAKVSAYFGLKQYDDVVKQFKTLGGLQSIDINYYVTAVQGMAKQLVRIKQHQNAISLYDLALLKQPNNLDIKEARGRAQTELELYKDKGSK